MLFNSTDFLVFFAAFALLYALVRGNLVHRNRLIVAASWLFYGWWDWRFLGLLILSSLVDFKVGAAMGQARTPALRRRWLYLSLGFNLGMLGFFKYFGFFLDSFHELLGKLGVAQPSWTWAVVLPVGISFYTFQTLSYTLDVYAKRIEPSRDLTAFLAFVAFFPQLVAGPIERASHLLPQFLEPRIIRRLDLEEGLLLVLWGLFKKVVFADQLAPFAELAFDRAPTSGPMILIGLLAFSGQIYGDFSGYSDVARGLARMLGFDLMRNFDRPYFATDIRDFWRRWHISLSTWLRDYLYIPLGGNRSGEVRTCLNLFLTMLIGGFWHGAAWNFVLWGAWHGLLLTGHRLWNRLNLRMPVWIAWPLTLTAVGYGWLLFRAGSFSQVATIHRALLNPSLPPGGLHLLVAVLASWLPVLALEGMQGRRSDPFRTGISRGWAGWLAWGALVVVIAAFWKREATPFIYFQF
jgi:D-alanyl-lipoteichoic acid acyltransferase DltB (MBOAT superfamily)